MNRRRMTWRVADIAVAVVCALFVAAVVPACLSRGREIGRAVQCSDNMRNINLALFQYAVGSQDAIPATEHNVYRALGVHLGDATDADSGGNAWRCPQDRLIPRPWCGYWYSYVPAADTVRRDEPLTCFTRSSTAPNSLPTIAPDTISWIEGWSPCMFGGSPDQPWDLRSLDLDTRDTPTAGGGNPQACNKATRDYAHDRHAYCDKGDDVGLTDVRGTGTFTTQTGGALPVADNVGEYRFTWGYCHVYAPMGRTLEKAFHNGRVNVSYIDGHVVTTWLKDLVLGGFEKPLDNPFWSRTAD